MEMNIFYIKSQIVHTATFTMRRSNMRSIQNAQTSQAIQICVHMTG